MPHLHVSDSPQLLPGFRVYEVDGSQSQTLRAFYEAIAEALDFPDDFGFTIESLDEMLSNLSWLDDDKIAVFVKNSSDFLAKERNSTKKLTLLDMLDAIAEEWEWEEGDDEFPPRKLAFIFDESANIRNLISQVYDSDDV